MRRVVLGVAIALVAALLAAAGPADATTTIVTESGVTVTVRPNNDVIVLGTPERDDLFILPGLAPGEVGIAVGNDSADNIVVSLVARNILMRGLVGDDQLNHQGGVVAGNVTFDGGPGNDFVGVNGGPAPVPDVQGLLMLNGGADDDELRVTDADLSGRVTMRGGTGFDIAAVVEASIAGRLDIRPGPGDSRTILDSALLGGLSFVGSSGVDDVRIGVSTLGPRPRLLTSGGSDRVAITAEWTGPLVASLGVGRDAFTLRRAEDEEVAEGSLRFLLNAGSGDDVADIGTFDATSVANGSSGADTLTTNGTFVVRSFETVFVP